MSWFNAAEHKPEIGLPGALLGKYLLEFTSSSQRVNQSGDGASLILNYVVIDGDNKGQSGSLSFNIWNKNDTSREIAAKELSTIIHCAKLQSPVLDAKPEGRELWGARVIIEVALQKEPNPNKYTQLVGAWDIQGNPPQVGLFAGQQQQAGPGPNFNQPQGQPPHTGFQQPAQGQPAPSFGPGGAPSSAQSSPNFGGATQTQQPTQSWQQQPSQNTKPAWDR